MSCASVLSIRDLQISLANQSPSNSALVSDVSLEVMRGKATGLIGASGSGKSLTCLAVMDLLPKNLHCSKGEVELIRGTVGDKTPLCCIRGKRAAMIMQNPVSCFDPVFTVGYHLKETLRAHKLDVAKNINRIRSTLAELGFQQPDEILAAYPFQLSGGMLQRIMVSLALLLEVELLIADEPTTDLDVIVQSRILGLIDRLKKEKNMGVLLVTHDLSVIARLADNVLVMHKGRVIESAPVAKLFAHPREEYTKALLSAHFSLYGQDLSGEVHS
ncbi:ABC transporter ATP-binding protein [Desulfogranum japonicum]|uniref:ABC transporter ATP-binding protein n=1 Tax=Desulfogranum japonicum TaxID=231447 RepID=UPI0003F4D6AD|nr:ABC transporter ATP-binding protein [Desulfogranum japonicum]